MTHALSLNDTFWVRAADADLQWRDVSLYQNPFNEIISRRLLLTVLCPADFSSTSPEFSTDGQYAKCWVREKDTIQLYKTGSVFGMEPVSEIWLLSWQSCFARERQSMTSVSTTGS